MPNDRRAIGRNPCHERNLFKNPLAKNQEKKSQRKEILY